MIAYVEAIKRIESVMLERGVKPHKIRSTMAHVTGLTSQSVHAWYQGATKTPSAEHLMALAEKYGLSYRWVVTGEGEKESVPVDSEHESLALDLIRQLPPHLQQVAIRQLQALADTDS